MYGIETMLWKEKEISKIRDIQMDSLRELPGMRRVYRVPNASIRELCGVKRGVNERIDEGVLLWFGYVKKDRPPKKAYVAECGGSCSLGRLRKRCL